MTLYFAYGSNMQHAAMARRWPAVLDGYQFFVGIDGWGSVKSAPGEAVYGVLWRLTPRDIAALHAYELLHQGLYDLRNLPVRNGSKRAPGKPRPGYVEMIAAAGRGWKLPERYIRSVGRWSTSRRTGARVIDAGELA